MTPRLSLLAFVLLTSLGGASCSNTEKDLGSEDKPLPLDCDTPRETSEGLLVGQPSRTGKTCSYLGVRFAAPPVGNLRFAPAKAPEKRSGITNAFEYGDMCIQKSGIRQQGVEFDPPIWGKEDCLFLNIWRPMGDKKPVMVFIHGGAFVVGAGSWTMYEGDLLSQEDVVVVTINYRMGPMGFFAYPGLITESGSAGNQGIWDQIQALKWVQENIESFGGDPQNVTIFGESAGGMSVCTLLASPEAKGLFQAAIIESGGCKSVAELSKGYSNAQGYLVDTGCDGAADPLACIRGLPEDDLMEALNFDVILSALEPHIDGKVLTDIPLNLIRDGSFNKVPLMAGSNANEIMIVSLINPRSQKLKTIAWPDYYRALEAAYGVTMGTELRKYYGQEDFDTPFDAFFMLKTDFVLACPTLLAAQAVGEQGVDSYHYIFSWTELGSFSEVAGTMHGLELFFIFGTYSSLNLLIPNDELPAAEEMSRTMRRTWANFARHHTPSADALPVWPTVDQASMVLNKESVLDSDIKRAACAYWDERLPMGLENSTDDLNNIAEHL